MSSLATPLSGNRVVILAIRVAITANTWDCSGPKGILRSPSDRYPVNCERSLPRRGKSGKKQESLSMPPLRAIDESDFAKMQFGKSRVSNTSKRINQRCNIRTITVERKGKWSSGRRSVRSKSSRRRTVACICKFAPSRGQQVSPSSSSPRL